LANPVVIDASAIMNEYEEASPNLPGISAKIQRPRGVKVQYLDEQGATVTRDFVGLEATSVQHQIDHLAGKMFVDNLSKTRRDMLLRKARKYKG
jgi:peptide deformylase